MILYTSYNYTNRSLAKAICHFPKRTVCLTLSPIVQLPAFLLYQTDQIGNSYQILLGTSAVALSYNVVHSLMIQQTSAVTTTVVGQAKIMGLLILSALLLGKLFSHI